MRKDTITEILLHRFCMNSILIFFACDPGHLLFHLAVYGLNVSANHMTCVHLAFD